MPYVTGGSDRMPARTGGSELTRDRRAMFWTVVLIIIGALLPIAVGAGTVYFGARGLPRSGGLVRAFALGIALGATGGALVSALVIGAVLLLRWART